MASQFLTDFRVLLEKVAHGNGTDQATKDAVTELQAKLADNDATDADQTTAINELTQKLGDAPPVTTPTA